MQSLIGIDWYYLPEITALTNNMFFLRLHKMYNVMVMVNANLDLKTAQKVDTGKMNDDLAALCEQEIGITFVARNTKFYNESWKNPQSGKTYLQIALPYDEVLNTDNVELLAYKHLYHQLDHVTWLDKERIKNVLLEIINRLENTPTVN